MGNTPKTSQAKKKAGKTYSFTATVDDVDDEGKACRVEKTFTLPSPQEAAANIPGRFLRDAAMNPDEGELALGFATLEAAGADPAAIDALYSLPAPKMLEHIGAWMSFKPAPEDASVGESSGSSA